MDEIVIKKQRQMTFSETFEFCLSSIKHRFVRSLLTLSVVVLAVAFFMFLQCSNIFRNSVKGGVENEILANRKPSRILGMLYSPTTEPDFVKMLVDTRRSPKDAERIGKVTGLDPKQMDELVDNAFNELTYLNFFDEMTIGRRKELFGRREGRARIEYLLEPGVYKITMQKMLDFGGIRVPNGEKAFKAFLDSYPQYKANRDKAFAKWVQLQHDLREENDLQKDSATLRKYLLNLNEAGKLGIWRKKLKEHGFELTDDEVMAIVLYQSVNENIDKMQTLLSLREFRVAWRRVYGRNQCSKMNEKLASLDSGKSIGVFKSVEALLKDEKKWTEQQLAQNKNKSKPVLTDDEMQALQKERLEKLAKVQSVTETDLKNVAREYRERQNLRDLELQLDINLLKDSGGFSASQIYLMCLSFLVCVVGITNAMLMSITERFREIATLKCLGATDAFILIQIVLEAMIQGVIGGFVGLIFGFIVALVNSAFLVGLRVFNTFDWEMIGFAALTSLLAGILLSVLSSLYPSSKAARMAPMEAMRVE